MDNFVALIPDLIAKTTKQDSRFKNKKINKLLIFKESRRAHRLLDGKFGLEIGASTHNPYGLSTLNIDFTDELNPFNHHEIEHSVPTAKGESLKYRVLQKILARQEPYSMRREKNKGKLHTYFLFNFLQKLLLLIFEWYVKSAFAKRLYSSHIYYCTRN
jgi:hypothetical protein